eukprot:COSAG01_NODE_2036_length_8581_cov_18.016977_7_plen_105_part_00
MCAAAAAGSVDLDIFHGQPDVCVGDSASSAGGGSEVELGLGATAASLQASAGTGNGSSAVLLAQPASRGGGASDHVGSESSFSSGSQVQTIVISICYTILWQSW